MAGVLLHGGSGVPLIMTKFNSRTEVIPEKDRFGKPAYPP